MSTVSAHPARPDGGPKPLRTMRRWNPLVASLVLLVLLGCLPIGDGGMPLPVPDQTLDEVEPNGEIVKAQALALNGVETLLLRGSFAQEDDVDLYLIGSLKAGDRITLRMKTTPNELIAAVCVFETDAGKTIPTLFATHYIVPANGSAVMPLDEVIRHDSDYYHVAIAQAFEGSLDSGSYELYLTVQRGGEAPVPVRQTVLLDFDGGSATARNGRVLQVQPLDVADVSPIYTGQTQALKDAIIVAVRENFTDYHVDIRTTDEGPLPAEGTYSAVLIGKTAIGDNLYGVEELGIVPQGVDLYNKNPSDSAIVFAQGFSPEILGSVSAWTTQQLGLAMGNVATHEIGHLLGLNHTFDNVSPMVTHDTPETLLLDQRFKRADLHFLVFPRFSSYLLQDERRMLAETVGLTEHVASRTVVYGDMPIAIAAGDMDGDGDSDLVFAGQSAHDLWILLNEGDGRFPTAHTLDYDAGPKALTLFDANRDGHLDILAVNFNEDDLTLLPNDGTARFPTALWLEADAQPGTAATADFNGDAWPDVAVANKNSNNVSILLNDGHGLPGNAVHYAAGGRASMILAGRFNEDDHPDLVTSLVAFYSNEINLSVLLNDGAAAFPAANTMTAGMPLTVLTAADFDGDGDLDLAVAGILTSLLQTRLLGHVNIFRNDGHGAFSPAGEFFIGDTPTAIASGDFDGDGDVDLAVTCTGDPFIPNDSGRVSVLLNRGDGSFARERILKAGTEPGGVAVADLDGDGDLDLAVFNQNEQAISLFFNDGQGQFGKTLP